MNFGDRIKKYRKRNKLSQKRFSEMVGISRSYLSEIESGKKQPSSEVEEKILEFLEKDTEKKPKELRDMSSDKDLKVIYKQRIIGDMKSLGTYKQEYEQLIDIYADLLVQYRNILQQYQNEKPVHDEYMIVEGKKSPLILVMENLRKDIITYSDRLVLNPKAIQGIEKDDKSTSKLAEALSGLG